LQILVELLSEALGGCDAQWAAGSHVSSHPRQGRATEMAFNVLAYNIKRVMALIGVAGLLEALAT
jgi:hypothetical protein